MSCLACDAEIADAQAICAGCRARLDNPAGFCREHVAWIGDPPEPGRVALVDRWGRPHFVTAGTVVGREPEEGLAVLESSVSRAHAALSMTGDEWRVRDLASRNGTSVRGTVVTADGAELVSGDRILFGDIAMYFVVHDRLLEGVLVTPGSTKPQQNPDGPRLQELAMRLAAMTEQGGGAVEIGGASVYLSPIQFELVSVLVERMLGEPASPPAVRGFVSSPTLLSNLAWATPYPTDNNLKQLVRRVRRAVATAGAQDLIESRQGFGYRLRFVPRIRPD